VLRVYPSGRRVWRIYYRRAGRPRWFTLGPVSGKGVPCALKVTKFGYRESWARIRSGRPLVSVPRSRNTASVNIAALPRGVWSSTQVAW